MIEVVRRRSIRDRTSLGCFDRGEPMSFFWKNRWVWVVCGWIAVIFFSSTSVAGQQSERAFNYLSDMLLPQLERGTSSYGAVHLLADKSVHLFLFSMLGILLWKAVANVGHKIAIILLIGAIVGSCSEFLQRFFPDRDPAITDVLINVGSTAIGVGISLGFVKLHARLIRRRKAELIEA